MPSQALLASTTRRRTRSVGFLELDGARWACYLITYRSSAKTWRGRLAFRTDGAGAAPTDVRSVRTAEIFVEPSESAIDRKARQMGRPLLRALLSSAIEVEAVARQDALDGQGVRGWVQEVFRARSSVDSVEVTGKGADIANQRSLYETYRISQMAHLVALMEQEALDQLVEEVLRGQRFEFGAKDKLQFAMMVVQRLEALLPLPPLEVFLEDYAQRPLEYDLYQHDLYAGGELP